MLPLPRRFALLPAFLLAVGACAPGTPPGPPTAPAPRADAKVGVLVMAHGGGEEWNESVRQAVGPLGEELPTEIAFGMANPVTLAEGVRRLEATGVERVAVVRMFLSGESFWDQTAWLLGMSETPPERFLLMGPARDLGPRPDPVAEGLAVATHAEGIMRSQEAADVIAARARDLSATPEEESVLILAHGMGDEGANDRVLESMEAARSLTSAHGFHAVRAATLREDWPEARALAEAEIRAFVEEETAAGRRVLVVPYRLSGFGPYAQVLDGLAFTPAEGLLPHPRLGDWVRRTATEVICEAGWAESGAACAGLTAASGGGGR